ncbi:guanylate kinase [Nocardioides bruguierae]|uniref:guanylate kinase n=1 Tax=Nocardioides bruguierae TaxID=2945102 RepID=UPI0020206D2D|nr:guanylate kinase [Nocardioides bruguierae]MCL8024277.1 guanylate kinase [Nocardioides bruguierae]
MTPPAPSRTPDGPARSRLVVLAGPTAVGKGTVAAAVRDQHPDVWISVSATTRKPRPGEVDGVHYHFVTEAEFDRLVDAGDMLEWAVVHKVARYGTPRGPVDEALSAGRPALLEIDLQGARQVRDSMPEALQVFLKPPSWEELVRRLVGRGTETEEERERRLATARDELAAEPEFDVTIVNHEVHEAADELVTLMTADPQVRP